MKTLYEDDDIIATKENFLAYLVRTGTATTIDDAEEAFWRGLREGDIRVCGRRGRRE